MAESALMSRAPLLKAGRVHDIEIVAINDLGDAATNARLMRYDTAHERCAGSVAVDDDQLVANGDRLEVFADRNPLALDCDVLSVDVTKFAQEAGMQNSRQAYVNLVLATAAFGVAFAAWSMISLLSHQIQADFNLDNTSIGLLIALPTLLGALMRVPMERAIAGIDSGLRWPDRCA